MKVLLVGWDAADWSAVQPLLDRGLMPRLGELLARSETYNLAPTRPRNPAAMWTSLATGQRASSHGILTAAEVDNAGSAIRRSSRRSLTAATIWSQLSAAGRRVQIYGWPATHPAEPLRGIAVSDQFAEYREHSSVYPPALFETIRELRLEPDDIDAASLLTLVPRAGELNAIGDQRLYLVAKFIAVTASLHAAATWGLEHEPWDFAAVRYDGLPRLHAVCASDAEGVFADLLANACRFYDMMLGRLLELAGSECAIVLVAASPPPEAKLRASETPAPWKLLASRSAGAGKGCMPRSILDVAPKILNLFGVQAEVVSKQPPAPVEEPVAGGRPGEDESVAYLIDLGYRERPDPFLELAIKELEEERRFHLAESLIDYREFDRAAPILTELLAAEPLSVAYRSMLAQVHFHSGRYDECRELVVRLVADGVDTQMARVALAALDVLQDKGEPATHLKRAEELGGASGSLLVIIGQLYLGLRRRNDAARVLDAALSLAPELAMAHEARAIAYLCAGNAMSAEQHARKAIDLDSQAPEAHYHLGLALARQDRAREAIDAFKAAVALDPRGATSAHGRLADLYDSQGSKALALHHRAIHDRFGRRRGRPRFDVQWISEGLW